MTRSSKPLATALILVPLAFLEVSPVLAATDSLILAEALDAPSLTWNTGGNAAWIGETTVTHDNQDASQSGHITHLQATWMETTVTGPGMLTFWWKVSSESFGDFLDFRIDNTVQTSVSGEAGWTQWSNSIPAGTHILRWQYSKDEDDISPIGSDAGWVDMVTYRRDGSPPNIAEQPTSRVVLIGIDATFSVTATGTAPLDFQWRFNGTEIAGATNSYYTINSAAEVDQGDYTIVITNFLGSVTSEVASLSVVIPPMITIQPQSQVVTSGASVAFSVVASGTAPLSYQWQWNGTNIAAATNDTFSISSTLASQAGSYQAVVTDRGISVTSLVAYLTVLVPPEITTQSQVYVVAPLPGGGYRFIRTSVVMAGTNVIIKASASGTPPLFYQWRFNGTDIDGATDGIYSLHSVSTNQTGTYQVVVSNIVGSATSAVVTLVVRAPMRFLTNTEALALTNGAFRLRVVDIPPPPTILVIETSTDLVHWLGIYTNPLPATSQKFVDFAASGEAHRFYRALAGGPLFRFALAATEKLDLGGNNLRTDSFDSTFGAYGGTNISAHGDVAAYLGVTNSLNLGNADIYGRIFTGSNVTINVGPQGSIGDMAWHSGGNKGPETGYVRDDLNLDSVPVQLPLIAGAFTPNTSGGTITLNSSSGYYLNGDLSLQNQTLLVTNANTFLYINGSLSMGGNSAAIVIAPGASLNFYVAGSVGISGQGVANPGGSQNFILYGLSTCTSIDFGGNGAFTGGIYAPQATLTLHGGGSNNQSNPHDFVGAVVANEIILMGYFNFHYDENLLRLGPLR